MKIAERLKRCAKAQADLVEIQNRCDRLFPDIVYYERVSKDTLEPLENRESAEKLYKAVLLEWQACRQKFYLLSEMVDTYCALG